LIKLPTLGDKTMRQNSMSAKAELIDRGGGLIYDTDLDITWLQDANYANSPNGMSWTEAMTWVQQLRYGGYDDWRLPAINPINGSTYNMDNSCDGSTDNAWNVTSPESELAYLF
jgi:hypothetical protein